VGVVGWALDHVAYIASEVEYRRGGYEAHMTIFGPGEAARIAEAHEQVLDALFQRPRWPAQGPGGAREELVERGRVGRLPRSR
jgi:hypothetical protein